MKKYYLINNCRQYYILLKCNRQQLSDYINYGHDSCITNNGTINIFALSEWLINRNIEHIFLIGKEKNIILRYFLKKDMKALNKAARDRRVFISEEQVKDIMKLDAESLKKLFW